MGDNIMHGKGDRAVFDSLPVDLIQRIAAMVPYTSDTTTRRCSRMFMSGNITQARNHRGCSSAMLYTVVRWLWTKAWAALT
jgi:hypothetical protein